jgi:hypothetical protein
VRLLSYSEVSTALDCQARWDFSYGDQLAGSSLKTKAVAPILSGGRAWGRAVAAYHAGSLLWNDEIDRSLEDDAERQREFGVHDQEVHDELRAHLRATLAHYIDTSGGPVGIARLEDKLLVPIPSRTGKRASSKFRLLCYIDGFRVDEQGRTWIREFKLRRQLEPVDLIEKSRQIRWYAWAYWQTTGVPVFGVEVDERWDAAPKPARMVQGKKKDDPEYVPSHAKDQLCTPNAYLDACIAADVEPHDDVVEALGQRRWQQVVPIVFRDGELEDAGRELVSAARFIGDLDSGRLYPLRNAKRQTCNGCRFKEICNDPSNGVVDVLFERKLPKRDREAEVVTT